METKSHTIIKTLIALVVLGGFYFIGASYPPKQVQEKKQSMLSFTSPTGALSFEYPSGYYVFEKEVGTPTVPQTAIVLVEDTEENRAIIANVTEEVREWPTMITIDAYPNQKGLSPEVWAQQETTWKLSDKVLSPLMVGSIPAVRYTWSGLYEGISTVLTSNTHAYVGSVTWMTKEDQILKDYEMILSTLKFQ